MFFVREIRYLYYYEKDKKICSAGTCKYRTQGDKLVLDFYLKKLHATYPITAKVQFIWGKTGMVSQEHILIAEQKPEYRISFSNKEISEERMKVYFFLEIGEDKMVCDEETFHEYVSVQKEKEAVRQSLSKKEDSESTDRISSIDRERGTQREGNTERAGSIDREWRMRKEEDIDREWSTDKERSTKKERDIDREGSTDREWSTDKERSTKKERDIVREGSTDREESTDKESSTKREENTARAESTNRVENTGSPKDAAGSTANMKSLKIEEVQTEADETIDLIAQQKEMVHIPDENGVKQEYYVLKPEDLVQFGGAFAEFKDNSFLLHGYYNYHHIILGPMKHGEVTRMRIGVPGNYYYREETVAAMFNFLSFVSVKGERRTGAYGYYFTEEMF